MLGADFVRGRFQRAKQEIEPARPVGRNLRQFRRRIRQFLLLEVLSDRGRGCCSDNRCKENCEPRNGGESLNHGKSLDAAKAACKAAKRQRPVISGNRTEPAQGWPWDKISLKSALTRLEAALDLVNHVDPALAADQTVVAMTTTQRFQRVTDLHGTFLVL